MKDWKNELKLGKIEINCDFCFGIGQTSHMDDPNSQCDICRGTGNMFFKRWLTILEKDPDVIRGYGTPLSEATGLECWWSYYDGGYSPREAILEDMTYWE